MAWRGVEPQLREEFSSSQDGVARGAGTIASTPKKIQSLAERTGCRMRLVRRMSYRRSYYQPRGFFARVILGLKPEAVVGTAEGVQEGGSAALHELGHHLHPNGVDEDFSVSEPAAWGAAVEEAEDQGFTLDQEVIEESLGSYGLFNPEGLSLFEYYRSSYQSQRRRRTRW